MKKIATFAFVTGAALTLAACGGKTEEAPATEATAEPEMMAPAEAPTAAEPMMTESPAATEEVDPTNNPIGPS